MASTFSTDLALELVATGEKAGLWGSINNTNLQVLEAATAFLEVPITGTTQTLSLADGSSTADGKHLYLKLTGTLTGNTTLTMPASTTGGTATLVFDAAGSDVWATGSVIESRASNEVTFDTSAASETKLTFTPANAATNLLTTGGQIAFICYEDGTWHIATKLAAETTQVTGAFVFAA